MANKGGGEVEVVTDFHFLGSKVTVDIDCSYEIRRHLLLGRKDMTNLDCVEKQMHFSADKGPYNQGYVVFSVGTYSCASWTVKNTEHHRIDPFKLWCWESLGQQGNQPWILVGRTDTEAETLVFWSSDANSWLSGRVPVAGKDWGQKEKRASEDEMTGCHHQCNGHELGLTLWDGEGQRAGLLQAMGLQRVRHNWVTQQQQPRNKW